MHLAFPPIGRAALPDQVAGQCVMDPFRHGIDGRVGEEIETDGVRGRVEAPGLICGRRSGDPRHHLRLQVGHVDLDQTATGDRGRQGLPVESR